MKMGIVITFTALLGIGVVFLMNVQSDSSDSGLILTYEAVQNIPFGSVHWHPHITININGEVVPIPSEIGITIGRTADTQLSGMRMSPTHTHESDGTIHLENLNPRSKPETLTLGYFFYVWGKDFNSTCIFDYCTNNGTLTMYINGEMNTEFQHYMMHDKDEIVINYRTK